MQCSLRSISLISNVDVFKFYCNASKYFSHISTISGFKFLKNKASPLIGLLKNNTNSFELSFDS